MTSLKSQQHIVLLSPEVDRAKVIEAIEQKGGSIPYRFGHEALIIRLDLDEAKVAKLLPAGTRLLRDQDDIPAGVSAPVSQQIRASRQCKSPEYRAAKEARGKSRPQMREWGTAGLPAPDLPLGDSRQLQVSLELRDLSGVGETLPTNERLINDVAVGVVIVDGPGDYAMSDLEREYIRTEVQEGLGWLGDLEPAAKVTWVLDVREVTVNFTPWDGARWPGMTEKFYKSIDAALYREDNEKIYLFSGNRYARFHMTNGKPVFEANRLIAGNWPGLPDEFTAGIDAALWRCYNDKIYLFKGSQYARFSTAGNKLTFEAVRPIAGNWPNLPADFESGIDAALMCMDINQIYFFKGDQYARFSNVSEGVDKTGPIADFCPGLPENFKKGIDAAVQGGDGKIYLFKSAGDIGTYVQISNLDVGVDPGFEWGQPVGLTNVEAELLWRAPAMAQLGYEPGDAGLARLICDLRATLDTQWAYIGFYTKCPTTCGAYANKPPARIVVRYPNFLPPDQGGEWWMENVDHYIAHETAHIFGAADEYVDCSCECNELKGEFFKEPNGNCFRCNPNAPGDDCLMRGDYRTACEHTRWHMGWGAFMTKIDAALWRGDNSKIYLFSNNRYIRFTNVSAGHDEGYPRKISGNWPDLPYDFKQGIDAALYRHDNGKIYLFKGNRYVRFSTAGNKLTFEANRLIAGNWPGLPESFQQGIDAAFWRESYGRIYFFKGGQYARFSLIDGKPELDYVKPIAGNWPGLPASFENGIDAALMRCSNNKIYFFKGRHYVRYLDAENRTDGGIQHINGNWMPFPK